MTVFQAELVLGVVVPSPSIAAAARTCACAACAAATQPATAARDAALAAAWMLKCLAMSLPYGIVGQVHPTGMQEQAGP